MKKVNLGLILLVFVIIFLSIIYMSINKNLKIIDEQLEVINTKLDHIEYDLHELGEK